MFQIFLDLIMQRCMGEWVFFGFAEDVTGALAAEHVREDRQRRVALSALKTSVMPRRVAEPLQVASEPKNECRRLPPRLSRLIARVVATPMSVLLVSATAPRTLP